MPSTLLLSGEVHIREADSSDEAIAALALQQQGIVGRGQLLDLEIGRRAISRRLAAGRLRLQYPGVYAVGHEALSFAGRTLAAVMSVAGRPAANGLVTAAAGHWTVASLRNLCEPRNGPIHVTSSRPRGQRRGIVIRRAALPTEDVSLVGGIPTTTVERMLLDLSGMTSEKQLRRLVKQAEFHNLVTADSVAAVLERHPRRPGRRNLAKLVDGFLLGARRTRSDMEDEFLAFCGDRGLPLPETNVVLAIGGHRYEVDCMWRDARLILELDSRSAHATDSAFEDDRARDRALIAAGWSPMRATWAHLHQRPDTLEREIRDALATRTARGRGFAGVEAG